MSSALVLGIVANQREGPVEEMDKFSVGRGEEERRDQRQVQNQQAA